MRTTNDNNITVSKGEKDNLLNQLLESLADNKNYFDDKVLQKKDMDVVIKVYGEGYRHSYSSLSLVINKILQDDDENGVSLGENIELLTRIFKAIYDTEPDKKITIEGLEKLRDHVNLEIGRFDLINKIIDNKLDGYPSEIRPNMPVKTDAEDELGKMKKDLDKINEKVEKTIFPALSAAKGLSEIDGKLKKFDEKIVEKLDKNSVSSITTLTIFSAVILAFTGSITFTAGVFDGMSNVSPFRIVFVTSLVGLVVFNLIFMLLFVVGRMTDRSVACTCKYLSENGDEKCGQQYCSKKNSKHSMFCVLTRKYPYLIIINIIIALIMYYDFILYLYNNPHIIMYDSLNVKIFRIMLLIPIIMFILYITAKSIFAFIAFACNRILYKWNVTYFKLELLKEYFKKCDGTDYDEQNGVNEFISILEKNISSLLYGKKQKIYKPVFVKISDIVSNGICNKKAINILLYDEVARDLKTRKKSISYIKFRENKENKKELDKLIQCAITEKKVLQ